MTHVQSRTGVLVVVTVVFLFAAARAVTSAQAVGPTVWNGAYTEAQASRGMQAFTQSCANCHALQEPGRNPLVGENFWKSFSQRSVADLLTYVKANMPNGNAGSLPPATYNDIIAVILKANGFPAGPTEVLPELVTNVQIIPRDGPGELPEGALVRIVGCLSRQGTDWIVADATVPQRIERVGPAADDAARPLGTRTIPLKFVLTRLEGWVGHRVSVSGLLIGAGGKDGVNVANIVSVAEVCH